ncbi:MAG TPA: UMP kinase [Fimbriimonadaceae bacterium]|nr:UMP kinase [Fimbriimonadaceae bacterium]
MSVAYPRVLLKISGEALAGGAGFGLDPATLEYIAKEIVAVHALGAQVAVVVGGGNFIRGEAFSAAGGLDRTVADHMGMLGTISNGLALQAAIEGQGVQTRVQSAINIEEVCEPFIRRRAVRHMEKGRVVVLAGGTGNPYFTTDTAAVLRAMEVDANLLIKATKVDGVYDKDPNTNSDAKKFETIGYSEVLSRRLAVMDLTAFTMCQENGLPIIVLDLLKPGSIAKAVKGETVGTRVEGD